MSCHLPRTRELLDSVWVIGSIPHWQWDQVSYTQQFHLFCAFLGSPPCNTYNLPSEFDIGKPGTATASKKGGMYTFGISREYYKKVYVPDSKQNPDDCSPGPGTYDDRYKTMGTTGQKWNMQGRSIIVNGKYHFLSIAKLFNRTDQHLH